MNKRMLLLTVALATVAVVARAKTIHVDCGLADYTDHDGSSAEAAYRTIQEGVEAADSGDVVLVAPGIYATGGAVDAVTGGGVTNRVLIDRKAIRLCSTGGAAVTHVVGAYDETTRADPTAPGLGSGAVRCLCIVAETADESPTVEGFTFRDGATDYRHESDIPAHSGGGVYVANTSGQPVLFALVADSVIYNCIGSRGGGVRGGKYVRCRIDRCDSYGLTSGARNCCLYGCLITRCGGRANYKATIEYMVDTSVSGSPQTEIVNCTISGNAYSAIGSSSMPVVYNTIISLNGTNARGGMDVPAGLEMHNCLLYSNSTAVETCIVPPDEYQLFSPASGDYRLVSTSPAVGAGEVEYLTGKFPEGYTDKDLLGNPRLTGGAINIGAIEAVGVPQGGLVRIDTAVKVDGFDNVADRIYFRSESYPKSFAVERKESETRRFANIVALADGSVDGTIRFYPTLEDVVWMTPPDSGRQRYSINYVAEELWVDQGYVGGDSDGSSERPYTTIQAAVDAVSSNITLISVRPGDYASGGAELVGLFSRVAIPSGKKVRIVSTDGPEVTIIRGAHDPSDPVWGCGDNAVRCCATASTLTAFQGFTFADGSTSYQTADANKIWGGGVRGYSSSYRTATHISDSVFRNCAGAKGAAATYATLQRCRIFDCKAKTLGIVRDSIVSGCVFGTNTLESVAVYTFYNSSVVQTTCIGYKSFGYATSENCLLINDVFHTLYQGFSKEGSVGNVYWNSLNKDPSYPTVGIVADPCLAAPGVNDHPLTLSPVLTSGRTAADYWKYVATDFEGRPYRFDGGQTVSGAYQSTEPCVLLASDTVGGIVPSGTNWAAAVSGMTVRSNAGRPFVGFELDGEVVSDSPSYTLVVPSDPPPVMTLKALYSDGHWYVDAVGGDDANGGGTRSTARKTLVSVLTNAVNGDVVTALPGTYGEGSSKHHAKWQIPSRAVVPSGVVLESEAGPEATVIEGRYADTEDPDPFKMELDCHRMGEGAVRCVYLFSDATLRGFTLRKGRTRLAQLSDDDYIGGGVLAADGNSLVENCRLYDCAAYRGGAAHNGTCRNCYFDGNFAFYGGTTAAYAYLYGCVSRNGLSERYQSNVGLLCCNAVVNCTILDGISQTRSGAPVQNSLFLGKFFGGDTGGGYVYVCTNCLFKSGCGITSYWMDPDSCRVLPAEQLEVDEEGRPVIGSNVAVDAGDPSYWPGLPMADALGGQRVYNGRLDIGALEADWRPIYAARLAIRRGSVTFASPNVVTNDEIGVSLPHGARFELVYNTGNDRVTGFGFDYTISSVGELRYSSNRTEPILLEGPTSSICHQGIDDHLVENTVQFDFSSVDTQVAQAVLRRFTRDSGLVLIVR